MEMKLERKPQMHRAIVSRGILSSIEYEMVFENKAEDILDIVIDISVIADRIVKLLTEAKAIQIKKRTEGE